MRVIWYAPGDGLGKASRAAAVCRHLDDVIVVRRGSEVRPLDDAEVPYLKVDTRAEVPALIEKLDGDCLVIDQRWDASEVLSFKTPKKSLHLHRFGRSFAPDPGVTLEGSHEGWVDMWPILYLEPEIVLNKTVMRKGFAIPEDAHLTVVVPSVAFPRHVWPEDSWIGNQWTVVLRQWPGMELLSVADRVVGAPGYNLWNEVNALGITDVRWTPMNKRPDQEQRANEPWREYTGNKDKALAEYIEAL